MKLVFTLLIIIVFGFFISESQAQFSSLEKENMLVITKSEDISKVVFDGKWSTITEWKPSTLSKFEYNDNKVIYFKSAHYGDYIYILIDFVNDHTLDKMSDKATICFDSKNNKSSLPDDDDYCFSAALGQKQGNAFIGGTVFPMKSNFEKIKSQNYISVGSKSDNYDRFSKIPHPSYEFRIPIDLLGRADSYGFFISVYDSSSNTYYNWPTNVERDGLTIPSPSKWGKIISPDKSIPEFNIPVIVISISVVTMIILSKKIGCQIKFNPS